MFTLDPIREEARGLLIEYWCAIPGKTLSEPLQATPDDQPCPMVWVLDDLLALLSESHDKPVEALRHTIRRLILERIYMDNMTSMDHLPPVERQVDTVILVMEKIRQKAIRQGQWSDQQPAPQMCG